MGKFLKTKNQYTVLFKYIRMIGIIVLAISLCACGHADTSKGSESAENDAPSYSENGKVISFKKADVEVSPLVNKYSFEEACKLGTMEQIDGWLPGLAEGTWYIAEVEGVQYFYGKYAYAAENENANSDKETSQPELFGYAIIGDNYRLSNGIMVGTSIEELRLAYEKDGEWFDVTIFENGLEKGGIWWNGISFPRSSQGMDATFDYNGSDYRWVDQFDYVMMADVSEDDLPPMFMGIFVRDGNVAAISFYSPTAG